MLTPIGTWWRTLRHLKWQQVIGRAIFRLHRPVIDQRAAPPRRRVCNSWQTPACREPSLIGPARFRFLNVEKEISGCGWNPLDADRLWLYNLHYFDDLNARRAGERTAQHQELVSNWIAQNPPAEGTGWEPYPLSLRLVNWIKWLLSGVQSDPSWLDSMAIQARWLSRRLEVHLLGNHLFANAKSLVFAGLFFDGQEAEQWLHLGLSLVARELQEQVLPDGGHYERSPMYHALALEDVLDLINVFQTYGTENDDMAHLLPTLQIHALQMLSCLRCMTHPGGQLALFNDCADGIAPTLNELETYAKRLGIDCSARDATNDAVVHLADSGYIRVTRGLMTAILDVAPIGPEYLPGHAHADTLAFELSLGGARLIANGGTSCYGTGERRSYERGTSAHNTVEVDNQNSSEVWSSFRVGRRAYPQNLELAEWEIACSHSGYEFLSGQPIHKRTWSFEDFTLTIADEISPAKSSRARYFLAPGLRTEPADSNQWRIINEAITLATIAVSRGRPKVERVVQAQSFGVVEEVECLTVDLVDGKACTTLTWDSDAHSLSH